MARARGDLIRARRRLGHNAISVNTVGWLTILRARVGRATKGDRFDTPVPLGVHCVRLAAAHGTLGWPQPYLRSDACPRPQLECHCSDGLGALASAADKSKLLIRNKVASAILHVAPLIADRAQRLANVVVHPSADTSGARRCEAPRDAHAVHYVRHFGSPSLVGKLRGRGG